MVSSTLPSGIIIKTKQTSGTVSLIGMPPSSKPHPLETTIWSGRRQIRNKALHRRQTTPSLAWIARELSQPTIKAT